MSNRYLMDGNAIPTSTFEAFLDSPGGFGGSRKSVHEKLLEELRDAAVKNGYSQGYKDGYEMGLYEGAKIGEERAFKETHDLHSAGLSQELQRFATELQAKIDSVNAAVPVLFADFEAEISQRAIDVVRQILEAELTQSRASTMAIVRHVLGEVTTASHARIKINPLDAPVLQANREKILQLAPTLRDIEFVEDATMSGGCLIETVSGTIDARIETRLASLEEAYREAA